MPSLPAPPDQPAPTAQTAQTSSDSSVPAAGPGPAPTAGFGILTSEPDALTGIFRDGRIRNPVPSKLKGVTDGSKGKFGVMQIEVAGRAEAIDRDAEAKRTSESTELAARRAFESGYVALRRSRFVHIPDEPVAQPVAQPFVPPAAPPPASNQFQRRTPLGPEETKAEQARLLTLLRSLHPVLVVDQICKALAFFGGIPGAPPPANGGFPESAEANGPGSLFVGWIAEIFPRLGGNSAQPRLDPAQQLDNPQPVKRKRGRPKGSKATKARKDKGVKKGPSRTRPNTGQHQASDGADESWVDVEDSGVATADDVDANVMLLAQATSPHPQPGTSHSGMVSGAPTQTPTATPRTALPGGPSASGTAADGMSSARRRGRPKGSRNRPKDPVANTVQAPGGTSQTEAQPSREAHPPSQGRQVPQTDQTAQAGTGPVGPQSFTAVNSTSPATAKTRAGRARGTEPKQQAQGQHAQVARGSEQQGGSGHPVSTNSAQVPAYRLAQTVHGSRAQSLTLPIPPTASPSQANPSNNPGQKRKRKRDSGAEAPQARLNEEGNASTSVSQEASGRPVPPMSSNPRQTAVAAAAQEPPPKRQRKVKESRAPARSGNEAAAHATAGTPATASAEVCSSSSMPNPSSIPGPTPSPVSTQKSQPALATSTVTESQVAGSMHSPQHGHFEEQSSTMENYEAQLQTQFEQQSEVGSRSLASQSTSDPAQLLTALPQQPQQHQQFRQQHQNQQHSSAALGQSPNLQPQSVRSPAVSSSSVTAQQQQQQPQQHTKAPQSNYNQYRVPSSQFRQHQQQSYVTSQPQQYASNQQSYSASQSYSGGGQQQLGSQQRYQHQLATSSAGTASYTTHHTSHVGAPTSSDFSAADNNYRGSVTTLSNPSYGQRSQSVTPSATTSFRAGSTHGLSEHSPQFGTGNAGLQQRPASTSQLTSQSMQGLAGVQPFPGNTAAEWSLFDTPHLDASGQQGGMGSSNANYGMSAASVRASSNSGSGFAATGLTSFDTSSLGGGDRFYGIGRR
ncbi:hypothetical protein C8A03DRAFT_17514 [Achaetomium macrosporum]|uniref:Uncharacterized protein n=1 Tax=Achaetomium macrosporum TaxID=79813 RepID=A0AAN7C5H5_9PEZI|nr:hypothetical protein C8A03DRAFT_17514 [Achaetomium macrosporum]